jgi:hypothetical protein
MSPAGTNVNLSDPTGFYGAGVDDWVVFGAMPQRMAAGSRQLGGYKLVNGNDTVAAKATVFTGNNFLHVCKPVPCLFRDVRVWSTIRGAGNSYQVSS